ncbi:MAG: SMR family transporter [Sneathiellaceae bacterium]
MTASLQPAFLTNLAIILLGVLLNAAGQLALKQGARLMGPVALAPAELFGAGLSAALNPYIWLGLCCYVISVGVWIVALSRVDVSLAYPMLSIGYIVTALAASAWFGEELNPTRIAGIVVIIIGVVLISRS